MYGINNTPTLTHAADSGAVIVGGLKQVITGSTNGTSETVGILQTVTGADTNIGIEQVVLGSANNIGIEQKIEDGAIDIKLKSSADTGDYCTIATTTHGATTITTVDSDATAADLTLDIDGALLIDADKGQARLTDGGASFVPAHNDDIATKGYVDLMSYLPTYKHTAVWGGNLGRIGAAGNWYGIPTGYQAFAFLAGTGSSPDTSYTLSSTADDLVGVIWASMHDITVTGCKIWTGPAGSTNTPHSVSLMRYDIDADGDLSNGIEVGSLDALNNDDYTHARAHTLTLSGTAANLDVDFSDGQILIAFVNPLNAYNSALGAKVILEYTEVET